MFRKMLLSLAAVLLLLTGCSSTDEVPSAPTTLPQAPPVQAPQQQTEPENIPAETTGESNVTYLPIYTDANAKTAFHCLVRNDTGHNITLETMLVSYWKDDACLQEATYGEQSIPQFFWRPYNTLQLTPMASTLLILPETSDGIYDVVEVSVTAQSENGESIHYSYSFSAAYPAGTLTDSLSGRESQVSYRLPDGWNWVHEITNDTDEILTLEMVHRVEYLGDIPMQVETKSTKDFNHYIDRIALLEPGQSGTWTTGVMDDFRCFNHRETIFEYRDPSGEAYYKTCFFRYEDAVSQAAYEGLPAGLENLIGDNAVKDLGGYLLTEAEITALAQSDITLEEAASRLSTVGDCLKFLAVRGFSYAQTPMHRYYYQDFGWNILDNAEVIFSKNSGACGCGSTMLNYLLRGDYDAQGYVMEVNSKDRHIYNWFLVDGYYYFVDWTSPKLEPNYHNSNYSVYKTQDPQIYSDYFVEISLEDEAVYDIYLQYLYQAEGPVLPIGIQRNGTPYVRTVPSSAKEDIILLYENTEICLLEYRDGPPEDLWPK